jgi:hypothetical protein
MEATEIVGFCGACCYGGEPGLRLVDCASGDPWDPYSTDRVVDIGIDRESFTSRGWSDEQLGRWSNGSRNAPAHQGLFLSLFYAIQNMNPTEPNHPWNENVGDWDRGLGAHIDYWSNQLRGLRYRLYAYDNFNPPTKRGVIVGRRGNEFPFDTRPNAIGHGGGAQEIYIRTDKEPPTNEDPDFVAGFALGRRTDANSWIWKELPGGKKRTYTNITHLLAHEIGHFLGFPHINDENSIMFCSTSGDRVPRWQTPESTNEYFKRLVGKLNV